MPKCTCVGTYFASPVLSIRPSSRPAWTRVPGRIPRDLLQVRAVVADAVVADDRDRQPAPGRAVIALRVPAVDGGHLVHAPGRDRDERTPLLGEDVRRRVVVVAGRVGRVAAL